jgi:hypothetical protein
VGDHMDKKWILSEFEKLRATNNFGIRLWYDMIWYDMICVCDCLCITSYF